MRACVRDVFAIYDDNFLPRLIMIIFKIMFLYFIEIAHTDDFPSTRIRLVEIIIYGPTVLHTGSRLSVCVACVRVNVCASATACMHVMCVGYAESLCLPLR